MCNMKNKVIYYGITILLFISILSFVSSFTYKQSTELDFKETCTRNGVICNSTSLCNVSIKYPDNSYLVENGVMTNKNNGDFNYTLNSSQMSSIGTYNWDMYCCQATDCGEGHGAFEVNPIGVDLTTSKSIIYIILFAILIFFFIIILFGIFKIPDNNEKDFDGNIISIGKLKYLKSALLFIDWMILIAIFYISSNLSFAYLGETLFAKTLFMFFRICFLMTPLIIILWFIWIFVQIVQDKNMKRLISKGIFPGAI